MHSNSVFSYYKDRYYRVLNKIFEAILYEVMDLVYEMRLNKKSLPAEARREDKTFVATNRAN